MSRRAKLGATSLPTFRTAFQAWRDRQQMNRPQVARARKSAPPVRRANGFRIRAPPRNGMSPRGGLGGCYSAAQTGR